jgi:membrane protease subunit HflK
MAWNTPGKDAPGKDAPGKNDPDRGDGAGRGKRNPWQPNRGGGIGDVVDRVRGMFGAGGGGLWRWVGAIVVLWLAFSCFVLIAEQQRGVVLRFGQFSRVIQPGPHLVFPWPVERVYKVEATQIQTFAAQNVPILTSDENIVLVEINVQYRVSDPYRSLFGTRDGKQVLEQAALSTVREQVGRSTLDTVLGARAALAAVARTQLQKSLDAYNTGLVVTELNLPNARPPEDVKPAFDDVNSAQQDKDRLTSEAQAYAARIVPEARGQASRVRTIAEGDKTAAIARATGDSERFSLLVDQYKNAPDVTRKRLWLETVQQVLAANRKVVGGDGRQLIYVPMAAGRNPAPSAPALTPDMIAPTVSASTVPDDDTRTERTPRSDRDQEPRR